MLLEAAIILPVLLMVVFGAIEFGYAVYVKHSLHGAACAGVRAGIVPGSTNADVRAAVNEAMARGGLGEATFTIEIRNAATDSAASVESLAEGDAVLVVISAPWSQYSAISSGYLSGDLTGRAIMRREG